MNETNESLIAAFPSAARFEARIAISQLAEDPHAARWRKYSVIVAGEMLSIPERIYHDASRVQTLRFPERQQEIVGCLMTRHADGLIRQHYLSSIIRSRHDWIPAFVIRLAGEYVVEILQGIQQNLPFLDETVYRDFLLCNPGFLQLTQKRIVSYWDCYYRRIKREDYAGFKVGAFFEGLVKSEHK